MLSNLHQQKRFLRQRESSYNRNGGNRDYIVIEAGTSYAVPQLLGAGIIRHLWFTVVPGSEDAYRKLVLQITFDEVGEPQVNVPLADLFMFGHGHLVDINNAAVQVSRQPHLTEPPYRGSLNCMFPMPFEHSAKVVLTNHSTVDANVFYYVDWEAHELLEEPVLYFHATLNQEHTTPPMNQPVQPHGNFDANITNLGWDENYCLLDARGYLGHYVGTSLSIYCQPGESGKWWEGDDMFIIDGEPWPPRLHGTGTEDYFNLAWGFRKVDCRPEYGVTYLDKGPGDTNQIDGKFSMYRLHISDPIPFKTSLLATLEHGHANDCSAEYRSVAYWYGRKLV